MILNPGNYLVFGRTGCGKSSFINSIAQADLAPIDNFKVCTKELTKYKFDSPQGIYQITDIPGFCEDENLETDIKYLKMAEDWLQKDENDHILFFCKFFDTRIRTEDHQICEYLASLIKTFKDKKFKISLIASFADFNKSKLDFERGFRLTRIRYLILIDYYCGLHYSKIKDFKKMNDLVTYFDKYGYDPKELDDYLYFENNENIFNGFFNSYAINNLLGICKSQWNEIDITPKEGFKFMFYSEPLDSNRSFLTSHEIFEDILGLKIEDILNWLGVRRETRRHYEYKEDPKPYLKYEEITNLILNLSKSSGLKNRKNNCSSTTPSILVVEPQRMLQILLLQKFVENNYFATAVGSAAEAINLYGEQSPDLLVSEEILEHSTGIRLAQQLGCSVIVLTDKSEAEAIANLLDEGADDVLRKPFQIDELLARCRKIIL